MIGQVFLDQAFFVYLFLVILDLLDNHQVLLPHIYHGFRQNLLRLNYVRLNFLPQYNII
uniref:Uncharacterized protein n=1 Tax=uncultured marine thaumarchaeote KM3_51_F10 TaxID=1456175 RepID=A0A075H8L0_9ARCH|nr:hypothetical protein [uncultured marine thaumarchaeote KM3_51_F10]